jgi:endonuclease YncB( thermonuclease family)
MKSRIVFMLGWLPFAALAAGSQHYQAVVTHVTDGDTVWVQRTAGRKAPQPVRVLGIDAPEICQPHGVQARDALAARVLHRQVTVLPRSRDPFQRTLAQVRIDGEDVGAWMVRQGHAWSYRFRRDDGAYRDLQSAARRSHLGLWRSAAAERPRDFRRRHGSCH